MAGPYDDGYSACGCFWGEAPSSLVRRLNEWMPNLEGVHVLDAGCGEGKNAVYLAARGAHVEAVDISELAIRNARRHWGTASANVSWTLADMQALTIGENSYDVVVAYGLLHCLSDALAVDEVIGKLQQATKPGGLHVVCTFNDRSQDLSAHPGFQPFLASHSWYLSRYAAWELLEASDADLTERHPHNDRLHTHSMTRLVARRT